MCVTNTATRRPVSLAPNVVAQDALLQQRFLFPTIETVVNKTSGVNTAESAPKAYPAAPLYTPYPNEPVEKPRPKRRRKPQKPGKTAKMNDRHFVVHNYHDHSCDADENDLEETGERRRGGVAVAFPLKLHAVLDQVEADGLAHVISWQPHGRCFVVHKPKEFVDHVMPKYFRQTKLTSFQRQLNLYGFCRLTRGPDASGYYHELFLRGKPYLCKKMIRTKVKGTKFKAASSPDQEPDFYRMPPVVVAQPPHLHHEELHEETSDRSTPTLVSRAAPTLSFEPIPVSGMGQQQYALQSPEQAYGRIGQTLGFPSAQEAAVAAVQRSCADRILDEAVDELFFNDARPDNEDLMDLKAWDLSNTFADDSEIEDSQLGMLLEKLLEE